MPRVEKRMKDAQEASDKAFADDVLRMMRAALRSEMPFERGETKEERLACVLTYLTTLVRENIINEGALLADEHPRKILAHEALRMLGDISEGKRHDIHKMFDGIRVAGRPSPSLDMHRGAIISACIQRVREIDLVKFPHKRDVIRKILKHPGLARHLEDESKTAGLVDRTEAKKGAAWMLDSYYGALKEEGGQTASSVIDRAAYLVGLRHNPLDMHAAMTRKPLNLIIYNPGAKHGEPLPDFITNWAAGKVAVKMVEVSRGQWVFEADGRPLNGFASVLERESFSDQPVLSASADAPDQS